MAKENGIKCTGFDWIPEYLELHDKLTSGKGKSKGDGVPVYIKDLVAGRPVFGHPARSGAFRFRYGRSRVDGFSAVSLHPATMAVSDNFIAIGTQLKIEKPTKGCAVASCDSIDGPIVKLTNGSVRKLKTKEEAKELYKNISEIIYLGDILFPFGDVLNRGANLITCGYVEEWWKHDLARARGVESSKLGIDIFNVSLESAIEFSKEYKIPLYPKYIFYWSEINNELFLELMNWIKHSRVDKKLILPYNKEEQEKFELGKRALELLGIPHEVTIENVILTEENSRALFLNLGFEIDFSSTENFLLKDSVDLNNYKKDMKVLEIVNSFSRFKINLENLSELVWEDLKKQNLENCKEVLIFYFL
jgi:DNA polymerase II large subunit